MKYKLEELNAMLNQGLAVYQHYYPEVTGRPLGQLNAKMISPFERSNGFEKDPSFSIYLHRSKGTVFFKDHAADKRGTHWQFVMDLFGIDFKDACEKVKKDILGIGEGLQNFIPKKLEYSKPVIKNTRVDIIPTLREFEQSDLDNYWSKPCISQKTLELFHCAPAAFFDIRKEEKNHRIYEKPGSPIYNFRFPSGRQKMLQPFGAPEFKWTSNLKADEDIFGFHLIPNECEHLFMIGGNKDTMSFFENIKIEEPFGVFALASESANLTEELFYFFRRIAKHLWVFYDNDTQGYRKAEKFKEEFQLQSLNHLLHPFNMKDFGQLMEERKEYLPVFQKNLLRNINKMYI